jgi:hypothetical protein
MSDHSLRPPAIAGSMRALLRAEGLFEALALVALYARLGQSWWLFGGLLLAPDLSFVGYLAGPRVGAVAYNAVHVAVGPAVLAVAGLVGEWPFCVAAAVVWAAHIALDRALGYGLKYPTGFGDTHLGRVGGAR